MCVSKEIIELQLELEQVQKFCFWSCSVEAILCSCGLVFWSGVFSSRRVMAAVVRVCDDGSPSELMVDSSSKVKNKWIEILNCWVLWALICMVLLESVLEPSGLSFLWFFIKRDVKWQKLQSLFWL